MKGRHIAKCLQNQHSLKQTPDSSRCGMVFIPACGILRACLHGESLCDCTMLLNHGPVAMLAARASALEQENARLTKCLTVLKQLDDDEIARWEQEGQAGTCSVGEAPSPVGALPFHLADCRLVHAQQQLLQQIARLKEGRDAGTHAACKACADHLAAAAAAQGRADELDAQLKHVTEVKRRALVR